MLEKIDILFVDDHQRFRKSIIKDLEEYGIVCTGEALHGRECMELLKKIKPQVVLLDLEMPVMDGNETFDAIKESYPEMKVFILSLHEEAGMIENYIHRGVKAYLPKEFVSTNVNVLAEGIKLVKNGGTFYPKYDAKKVIKYSKRETEVIALLMACKTSKEIGVILGIEEKQVKKIRSQLHKKTSSRNATAFIKYCVKNGMEFMGKK